MCGAPGGDVPKYIFHTYMLDLLEMLCFLEMLTLLKMLVLLEMLHLLEMLDFNCWFSHDVTKFQTSELLILLRFYFHDVLEQLKTNIQTNFHSEWVLGLVIDYA